MLLPEQQLGDGISIEEQSIRAWTLHSVSLQSENWHMLPKNLWKQPSAVNLWYQNVYYIKTTNKSLLFYIEPCVWNLWLWRLCFIQCLGEHHCPLCTCEISWHFTGSCASATAFQHPLQICCTVAVLGDSDLLTPFAASETASMQKGDQVYYLFYKII